MSSKILSILEIEGNTLKLLKKCLWKQKQKQKPCLTHHQNEMLKAGNKTGMVASTSLIVLMAPPTVIR